MRKLVMGLIVSGLALAGCATTDRDVEAEARTFGPQGRTIPNIDVPSGLTDPVMRLRVISPEAASVGAVNTFYLNGDGSAVLIVEPNEFAIALRWSMQGDRLCYDWPVRGEECWPYAAMRTGQSVRMTSSLGVVADVTRLSDRLTMR